MANTWSLNSISRLRRILFCTSVLSSGLMLAAVPQAAAGCVNTSNSLLCSNGSEAAATITLLDNPDYVGGDYLIEFDNFQQLGGGLAIFAPATNSTVIMSNGSSIAESSDGSLGAGGVYAASSAEGNVIVNLLDTSSVRGIGNGVYVQAGDGSSQINTATVASEEGAIVGQDGVGVWASAPSNVQVDVGGEVSGGYVGILADSAYGDVHVTTGPGPVSGLGFSGIQANAFNGKLELDIGGDVTGRYGIFSHGLETVIKTAANSEVTATEGLGIYANGGKIDIETFGKVSGQGLGIYAYSDSSSGSTVITHDTVRANGGGGIAAISTGFVSRVEVTANGDVFGGAGTGILALNVGLGSTYVFANGDVFGSVKGIEAIAYEGAAEVTIGTGMVTGQSSNGVFIDGGIRAVLMNDGEIRGSESGVFLSSLLANHIVNNGVIENLRRSSADLAVAANDASTKLDNSATGIINGRIELMSNVWTGTSDSFANQGLWQSTGMSDFGGGVDTIANSGVVRFSSVSNFAETTTFSGLELLENSGLLSGQDQASADGSTDFDTLTLSGDYVGNSGAIFALDAYLGGPGTQADVVTVQGSTSGSTAIQLNNTNSGVSDINTDGILLVDVKGGAAASDFYLADGPISAGLFDYALNFQASADSNQFLLQSAQGAASHETVVAVDAVQVLWQGGADAWRLHQVALRDEVTDSVQIEAVADPVIAETQNSKVLWANFRGDWAQRSTANAAGIEYNQQTFGLDGGADFVMDAGAHQKIMFGIVAGYQTSQVGFDGSANGIEFEGGSLGAHAGFIAHGFFADVLVKQDWLALEYTLAGTGTASTNARTFGVSGDLGYRFGVAKSFVEPMVSFASSKTTIGDFVLGSGLVSPDANNNTRVGAGVRVGFTDETYSLSMAARVWQGLDKGNSVNVSGTGLGFVVSNDGISHGVAGELSGKIAVNLTDASQIFAAGSVQFGEDGNSQSVSGGLQFAW